MILNPGKCHFMSIGKDTRDEDVFYYDNLTLKNSNEEEILGVTIDKKLTFHQHIKKMCRKAGQKLSALLRLSPYLDTIFLSAEFLFFKKFPYKFCFRSEVLEYLRLLTKRYELIQLLEFILTLIFEKNTS